MIRVRIWVLLLLGLCGFEAKSQNDAGLVWASLYPGAGASNAVHNIATTGLVGNTRGPIQNLTGGIASNNTATAAWIGLGTNVYPIEGARELTLSVWAKQVGTPTIVPLHNNTFSTGITGTYQLAILTGTRMQGYVQTHGTTNYVGFDKSGLPNIVTSNWVHLAMTWVGVRTNVTLWINANNMTVTTTRVGVNVTNLNPNSNENRVGAWANALGTALTSGKALTMARIYNRALSTNEIKELYIRERAMLP